MIANTADPDQLVRPRTADAATAFHDGVVIEPDEVFEKLDYSLSSASFIRHGSHVSKLGKYLSILEHGIRSDYAGHGNEADDYRKGGRITTMLNTRTITEPGHAVGQQQQYGDADYIASMADTAKHQNVWIDTQGNLNVKGIPRGCILQTRAIQHGTKHHNKHYHPKCILHVNDRHLPGK